MAGDCETVRFVAHGLDEVQRGMIGPEQERLRATRNQELL
jgi:hypothetical protein